MFRWPQNGRSRGTKSSNLSGEEVFLPGFLDFRNKSGNVHFITWKLNSNFGTIGKATGLKMTAKVVSKNPSFRFSVKNNLNM